MHLAIILPAAFDGGVLRSAFNIARTLIYGAEESGDDLNISFGYPNTLQLPEDLKEKLERLGINMRPYKLEFVRAEQLPSLTEEPKDEVDDNKNRKIAVFNDGVSNFEEADFWLILSDYLPYQLPEHKPYAVMVYDYVHRYVPEIYSSVLWRQFDERARMTRCADFVMTTSNQTKQDVISFIGYPKSKIKVFPLDFNPVSLHYSDVGLTTKKAQIVWPTILSNHENHLYVLSELEAFLKKHPETTVHVIGPNTARLSPRADSVNEAEYVLRVKNKIKQSKVLTEGLVFHGFIPDEVYARLIAESMYLLHTSRFDNGSYTVIEAAWSGTASVSAYYNAMNEISEKFGLGLMFFDSTQPGSLSDVLTLSFQDEQRKKAYSSLPSKSHLLQYGYEKLGGRYWGQFKKAVNESWVNKDEK